MLHAAITNSYYGMEYMLYGKNTAGSARGGVAMKTVSGKTGETRAGRDGGTACLPAGGEGRRTAGQGGRFFASVQPCGHGRTFPQKAEKKYSPAGTLQPSARRSVPRPHTALEPSSGCRTESCYPRAVSAFSREYAAAPCFCKKADASALQSSLRTS